MAPELSVANCAPLSSGETKHTLCFFPLFPRGYAPRGASRGEQDQTKKLSHSIELEHFEGQEKGFCLQQIGSVRVRHGATDGTVSAPTSGSWHASAARHGPDQR